VDDRCYTDSFVAAGADNQLHAGGFIHIILVIAIIVLIIGFFQGRSQVKKEMLNLVFNFLALAG